MRTPHDTTPDLVLTANQAFHDIEAESYANRHPEIFQELSDRWLKHLAPHLPDGRDPIRMVDIGSGTGFVPLSLRSLLQQGDELVCSDLSAGMLDMCKKNIEEAGPPGTYVYTHLDGKSLASLGEGYDLVTMNSVLHHVPDPNSFLLECSRMLKAGGLLVIGHEPNLRFLKNRLSMASFHSLRLLKRATRKVQRIVGLSPMATASQDGLSPEEYKQQLSYVADRLVESGCTEERLSESEIEQLIDYSSPTAGGQFREVGFDATQLVTGPLEGFAITSFESYRPLGWESDSGWLGKAGSRLLAFVAPRDGATFFCVLRKDR